MITASKVSSFVSVLLFLQVRVTEVRFLVWVSALQSKILLPTLLTLGICLCSLLPSLLGFKILWKGIHLNLKVWFYELFFYFIILPYCVQ